MKGIILAGGSGSRLNPLTKVISKQLIPVYDKPMIYYPLSTLMFAAIKEILIISTPKDIPRFQELLEDGKHLGIHIEYAIQNYPNGLAEAFIIGEKFIGNDSVCLILGDNIFYGESFPKQLQKCCKIREGAIIFAYYVQEPKRYGIIEFAENKEVIGIEEKPRSPKSNWGVTGLYFYDNDVVKIAKTIKPSNRGELEITDVNKVYLKRKKLKIEFLGRGIAWLDAGTYDSLLETSNFIKILENRQGLRIACIEEIAYRMGYINLSQLEELAKMLCESQYGQYLLKIIKEERI